MFHHLHQIDQQTGITKVIKIEIFNRQICKTEHMGLIATTMNRFVQWLEASAANSPQPIDTDLHEPWLATADPIYLWRRAMAYSPDVVPL